MLTINWWRKANIIADHVVHKLRAKLYEQRIQFNLALLSYDNEQQTFDLHRRQYNYSRNKFVQELMPWLDTGPLSEQASVAMMRKQYVKTFADPQSEKGKRAIHKQLEKWGKSYVRRFMAK